MLTLEEVKKWLGISGDGSDSLLLSLITAADADLRAKAGDYTILSGDLQESAKLYMKYWIGVTYADRFGEMSNKESAAISGFMSNTVFILRQAIGEAEDEANT